MPDNEHSINYEQFEKIHVVRRLRQIIGSWWKVQLNFTDEKGFVRGVPQGKFFNPVNSICTMITQNTNGFADCKGLIKSKTINFDFQNVKGARISQCHAGFSILSFPIIIGNKFLGMVIADGFLLEESQEIQKEYIKSYLKKTISSLDDMENLLSQLPVLSQKDLGYLIELLEVVIDEVLSMSKLIRENDEKLESLLKELRNRYDFGKMVGSSPAMVNLFNLLAKVSESDATILITGENGTGKEGIARAIHYNSKRKKQNFVIQNCGALNENLLESELFGHVKGAFTSAIKDKKGLFELADRGTLFLDEIGDTSPSMQVKLLRVLQEGTFIPVGGTEQKKVDVRVLAATNKNLQKMVKDGSFREDLYYRLNVINLNVPPLRDRKDDIPLLISRFLDDYAQESQSERKHIAPACMEKLLSHEWPGNVRELQNEIERLCILSGNSESIDVSMISERILNSSKDKFPGLRLEGKLKDALDALEKKMIFDALTIEGWNKSRASKLLGISRAGLINKCEKYGFDRDESYKKDEAS